MKQAFQTCIMRGKAASFTLANRTAVPYEFTGPIDERRRMIELVERIKQIESLPKICLSDVDFEKIVIIVKRHDQLILIRSDNPSPSNVFPVTTEYKIDLTSLYNKLIQSGRFHDVLNSLKENIGYLRDLRSIGEELFAFFDGLDKPIPISSTGDGFQALLRIAFAIALSKEGTLVLEEPESNLHPGFIELTTTHMAEYIKKYNIQTFISTHSSKVSGIAA
ncbi:MAG: AAA family ATPase [Candidatus Caldarchaeum sp.]